MGPDAQADKVGFAFKYVATLPLQFVTEPILDTLGTPAWGNMVRRTRSMFHPQGNYVAGAPAPQSPPDAGAEIFFRELTEFMNNHGEFTLDVYAHSMGAMIMNEAFAEHPDIRVHCLTYMAAACSIRDFRNTAGRYIEKHPIPFYNLSLHPRAELNEVDFLGVPVRGSLLVWVDEFFNQPRSFADRTLGTFENAVVAENLLPQNSKVYLKAFGTGAGPQKHADFHKYCFWTDEFRDTSRRDRSYKRIDDLLAAPRADAF
jgi:pimeloyl-ACP methyl ester carboxylesterase